MNVNSVSGSTSNPLYQIPEQKSGGQVLSQQQQPAPAQGPAEESKESSAPAQSTETGEGTASRSINVYA